MVFFLIVNNFVQPYYIWMLKALEYFKLFEDAIIGTFASTCSFLTEFSFIHFLNSKHFFRLRILAKIDFCKTTFAEGFDHLVVVDAGVAIFFAFELAYVGCRNNRALSSSRYITLFVLLLNNEWDLKVIKGFRLLLL